ncbi:spore germination protein [Alkaliphilus metalliredigens QYMF]|uniref:Spore germination protein n=1 Tax=Alkaliphilus metalliredigens (strain QYMF) TaxID=293826 RepID=A6TWV1_ALKMQ|nr:endospore germination permease [Alkaliphilus metalliredigens]ABR50669.1 spore germination protein [Alkaliphilus metalliredigens QYMF]
MYSNNDSVSTSQMINIVILTMVGVGALTLPQGLAESAGADGWVVLITGALVAIGISFVHGYIVKSFPGKGFFEILSFTLTKPMAYAVGIYTTLYFIGMTGYVVRIFSDVVKTFLLPRTPVEVIFILMLLVSIYLVRGGIEVLGRMAELIIIPLGVLIIILFTISWQNMDISNLLPIFQLSFSDLLQGVVFALFSFLGFEVLLIFGGFLNEPKKATKIGLFAIAITLLLYLMLNASVLGVLGEQQLEHLTWPLLNLFGIIELPGAFIENVQAFVMVIWTITIFTTIAPFYLAATVFTMQMTGGKEHRYYALPILPLVFMFARWDGNIAAVYENLGVFTDYTAYGVVILIPIGVALSTMLRRTKKMGKEVG